MRDARDLSSRRWPTAVAYALVLLCGLAAQARPGRSADDEARGHYLLGQQRYDRGDFRGAIDEFAAGYALVPLPHFQFDIARAYEKLGELNDARSAYERFLAGAAEGDRFRARAETALAEITRMLAVRAVTEPAPRDPSELDAVRVAPTAEPVPAPSVPPLLLTEVAPPKAPARKHLRYWWLIPIGVVVAGGAAALIGVLVTQSHKDSCATASLGCLPLGR